MAMNPMQKKARTSFLLGMFLTLIITGIIIALLIMQLGKIKKELVYGVDYEISGYENNVKKGSAVVIFKGKGDYAGEKAVKFKIKSSRITE